jgi:hypothetical protein
MIRWAVPVAVVAFLFGCATSPNLGARSRYHGVPVDSFFYEWGAPVAKHKVDDGTMAYLWFTGRSTAWWEGYNLKYFMSNLECGVRIFTYPDGTIRDVLLKDSNRQWWEQLRCREVFGPPLRW